MTGQPSPTATDLASWEDRVFYYESAWLNAAASLADAVSSRSRGKEALARARLDAVAAKLEMVTARRDRVRCELNGARWLRLVVSGG